MEERTSRDRSLQIMQASTVYPTPEPCMSARAGRFFSKLLQHVGHAVAGKILNAEHLPGCGFGHRQCCLRVGHRRTSTTAAYHSLDRLRVTNGCHADRAFEHLAGRRKNTSLNGHVPLGLFERHNILHKFVRTAGRNAHKKSINRYFVVLCIGHKVNQVFYHAINAAQCAVPLIASPAGRASKRY